MLKAVFKPQASFSLTAGLISESEVALSYDVNRLRFFLRDFSYDVNRLRPFP